MNLFASDFDGTLYFMKEEEKIRREDIEAIRDYQRRGNYFGLCTGRSLQGILLVVTEELIFDFYILASGALILDRELNVIYQNCITFEQMKTIYERYEGRVEAVIQANDTVYNLGKNYPLQTRIDSLDMLRYAQIYGLSFGTKSEEDAKVIAAEINSLYGDTVTAFRNVKNVDLVAKGCSKGNALQIAGDHFQAEAVGAIGDSYNDLPMLLSADAGFGLLSAPEEMKKYLAAEYLVNNVKEALDHFQDHLKIVLAQRSELRTVVRFYEHMIDQLDGQPFTAGWKKGIYPSEEMLEEAIEYEELYLGYLEDRPVAAMIINHDTNEAYDTVEWPVPFKKEEITVVHALGVDQDHAKRGFAKQMMRFAMKKAEQNEQKAIRLDVLSGNHAAERLYPSLGFQKLTTVPMFYEDTGWTDFHLYEYQIPDNRDVL